MRLLLVEDDEDLARELRGRLRDEGYAIDVAANGIDAEHLGREEDYDLILLDLGLPDRPGLDVLRHWRSSGIGKPVIILTARDAWHEKVDGLKAGADDYVAKPFHFKELLARIQAVIRRSVAKGAEQLTAFGITLNEDQQAIVLEGGERLQLTGTEFKLLRYLMLHRGKILSKSRLTEHLYEFDDERDSNVIEVYVNRLRQKLGKQLIQTLRGQGYVFGNKP
ncbi:MAG: response regulator transcription factor [Gammaproteobacteria bacterium]